jgi:hypothetical protein
MTLLEVLKVLEKNKCAVYHISEEEDVVCVLDSCGCLTFIQRPSESKRTWDIQKDMGRILSHIESKLFYVHGWEIGE